MPPGDQPPARTRGWETAVNLFLSPPGGRVGTASKILPAAFFQNLRQRAGQPGQAQKGGADDEGDGEFVPAGIRQTIIHQQINGGPKTQGEAGGHEQPPGPGRAIFRRLPGPLSLGGLN